MNLKRFQLCLVLAVVAVSTATVQAQPLFIDFDNGGNQDGGPHTQAGYQSYIANHEVAAEFTTQNFNAFGTSIAVTPAWPNSTANTVMQMIDRAPGNDANWTGERLDLLTDWIGTDSRTAQGGNGDWDRTAATTPTYMTLSLGGLPEGTYDWLSYHHDTENIWSDFQVEISKDGGASYVFLADKQMTDSTPGGAPDSLRPYVGVDDGAGDNPNPALLPSTFKTSFTVGAADNIVFRFAEYIDGVDPVDTHKLFFAMNGFELTVAGQQLIDGDVNGDRVVTLADFEIIRDHFMMSTTQRTEGDLNFDGVVSWEDFRQWKLNVPGGAPNVANVPEPASLAIACLGLLGLAARRRR